MRNQAIAVLVAAVCVGGCTTTGSTPATAPEATAPAPITTEAVTTTVASTTVPDATTTTTDRLTEIQAIFEDLEHRRLKAIAEQDVVAYELVFSNDGFLEASRIEMGAVTVSDPAGLEVLRVDLLNDRGDCVAIRVDADASAAVVGGAVSSTVVVLEEIGGDWGFSYVGEGWLCDGPHPFS